MISNFLGFVQEHQMIEEAMHMREYDALNGAILSALHNAYPDQHPHEAVKAAVGVDDAKYDELYKPLVDHFHKYLLATSRNCTHLGYSGIKLVGSKWGNFNEMCAKVGVPNRYPIELTPEAGKGGGFNAWVGRAKGKADKEAQEAE